MSSIEVRAGQFRATTTATQPAAGADVAAQAVPAGEHWELHSVLLSLVTSATVANRRVTLVIDDGTNVVAKIPVLVDQAASLTYTHSFIAGLGYANSAVAGATNIVVTGIPRLTLPPGYRISTVTSGIQTGDQYGVPVLSYTKRAA